MKDVGVHHKRLEYDAAQEDHHYPQIRQDDRERDLLFFHGLLLWFRRCDCYLEPRRSMATMSAIPPHTKARWIRIRPTPTSAACPDSKMAASSNSTKLTNSPTITVSEVTANILI